MKPYYEHGGSVKSLVKAQLAAAWEELKGLDLPEEDAPVKALSVVARMKAVERTVEIFREAVHDLALEVEKNRGAA